MNVYPFTALATAQAFSAIVDASKSIPFAGTPIGGGIHVPGPTLRWGDIIVHPTLALWGYEQTPEADALAPSSAVALGGPVPAPVPVDASWGVVAVAQTPVVTA